MNLPKMATIGLAVGLVGAAVYLTVSRRPNLQARVRVDARGEGFPDFGKTCPKVAPLFGFREEEAADYTFAAAWVEKGRGWIAVLERKDGVVKSFEQNQDAKKILREACRAIEEDFPVWLFTEHQRLSAGAQAQIASRALEAKDASDVARRYELKEYRHGSIVGLALVDTVLGRTWVLLDILDAQGKKVRSQFEEVGVETLWQTNAEVYDQARKASDEKTRRGLIDQWDKLSSLKSSTRPRAIREAETKAFTEGLRRR